MHANTTATIISPNGETATFDILAGVLQGDALAPFLFVVVLDYVLRLSLKCRNAKRANDHA